MLPRGPTAAQRPVRLSRRGFLGLARGSAALALLAACDSPVAVEATPAPRASEPSEEIEPPYPVAAVATRLAQAATAARDSPTVPLPRTATRIGAFH